MNLNQIFILGLLFRILIFIILSIWPFNHLIQGSFGPMSFQNADITDYQFTLDLLLMKSENLTVFINNYIEIIKLNFSYEFTTIPGPLFPLILGITNYNIMTPYFLAFFCFIAEIICFYIWIHFFYNKIKTVYIFMFAFFPIPLMFGFIHSTDIFFYLISTLILIRLVKYEELDYIAVFLLILSLMLRPASLALLLTIYLYFILINYKKLTYKINIVLITASLLFILYYLPYFLGELNRDKVQYPYYFNNIFIFHTEIVQNEIIRIFVIFFMKFLFLFGFDPTESGYPIIQIIRSFIGTIFIIGFFKTFYYKKIKLEFIYIWSTIFFIVIFFYPTYRYIVPVMPLLYLLFFMRLNKIY